MDPPPLTLPTSGRRQALVVPEGPRQLPAAQRGLNGERIVGLIPEIEEERIVEIIPELDEATSDGQREAPVVG